MRLAVALPDISDAEIILDLGCLIAPAWRA
jgi:hypothetical protein